MKDFPVPAPTKLMRMVEAVDGPESQRGFDAIRRELGILSDAEKVKSSVLSWFRSCYMVRGVVLRAV